jgi:glycogen synthase
MAVRDAPKTPSPLRILITSWEYPPLVVGGIAAHVDGLSRALAQLGHDVVVFTMHHPDAPDNAMVNGVHVLRAHTDLPWFPPDQFVAKMTSANHQLVQLTSQMPSSWRPDIVHSHDWLTSWAGDTLKAMYGAPMVATIHATERGRNGGYVPTEGQPAAIHAAEWWLTYQAKHVICCSDFMVNQVRQGFEVPTDKLSSIPNGVEADLWAPPVPAPPRGADGPLIVSWGRVQYEKGFQTLVEAMPLLREWFPGVRAVIAGTGSYRAELAERAASFGVGDIVHFAGFVPDDELRSLLHHASCVVMPSFYEPFGIVALEALAAQAPLVAADSGGLAEVLGGTEAGLLFPPGDARALAESVARMLGDDELARRCVSVGRELVSSTYTWSAIAESTVAIYRQAVYT